VTGGGFGAFATGGPSAFGASGSAAPNPFGQSQPASGSNPLDASSMSAFGRPATTVANPFGQSAAAPQQGNPLDPPSAFGQSTFGQPSQPANPFGQSTGAGLSSGFGSMGLNSSTPTAPANPFGPRPGGNPLDAGSPFGAGTTPAPVSVFGNTPSAFGAQPQAAAAPPTQPVAAGTNIFASLSATTGVTGRPIHDPYASLLPPNYMDMLPKEVKDAFASDRFVFGEGEIGVPWWIPPLEMR
jgi:nucleoporin NUP42